MPGAPRVPPAWRARRLPPRACLGRPLGPRAGPPAAHKACPGRGGPPRAAPHLCGQSHPPRTAPSFPPCSPLPSLPAPRPVLTLHKYASSSPDLGHRFAPPPAPLQLGTHSLPLSPSTEPLGGPHPSWQVRPGRLEGAPRDPQVCSASRQRGSWGVRLPQTQAAWLGRAGDLTPSQSWSWALGMGAPWRGAEALEPGAVLCWGPEPVALASSSHHNGPFVGPALMARVVQG